MPATRGKHRPWSFTKRSHAPLTAIILPSLSSTAAWAGNAFSTSVIVAFVPREELRGRGVVISATSRSRLFEQRGEFSLAEHPVTQQLGCFNCVAGCIQVSDIVRIVVHV